MNLITLLQSCSIEPSAEDLADICWLAQRMEAFDAAELLQPAPTSTLSSQATPSGLPPTPTPSLAPREAGAEAETAALAPTSRSTRAANVHGYQQPATNVDTD